MAIYKQGSYLTHSEHAAFDYKSTPGDEAVNPGIYRCAACGDEIAIAKGHITATLAGS